MDASHEKNRQYDATNANWTRVKVAGMSNALRMDFEDVFVRTDVVYHTMQRICVVSARPVHREELRHTISRGDTGARSASAISWAFWLTLPCLVRIVRIASLRLFCLACPLAFAPFPKLLSRLGSHLGVRGSSLNWIGPRRSLGLRPPESPSIWSGD